MDFINSWKSKKKQGGKVSVKIRIGRLTIFDYYWDKPRKCMGLIIFNFGVKKGKNDALSL